MTTVIRSMGGASLPRERVNTGSKHEGPGEFAGPSIASLSAVLSEIIWPEAAIQDSGPNCGALAPTISDTSYSYAVTGAALEPCPDLAPRRRQNPLHNLVRVHVHRNNRGDGVTTGEASASHA